MVSPSTPTLATRLQAIWQRRGPAAWLLWPLSRLYGWAVERRRRAFLKGTGQPRSVGLPVIVVGNVIAGGAGKTPVTQAVVAHLRARGWRPGIVSRGYGRSSTDCREALPGSPASEVGDEPALLARSTGVPVFVARQRVEAAQALRARYPEVDIIVSDDGLQHWALARDIELCVFNEQGAGNGFLLPAGPLREPWPRAVSAVLYAGAPPQPLGDAPAFALRRSLATRARDASGHEVDLAELAGREGIEAVAAIARPEAFFEMLAERGLRIDAAQALPDHADFARFKRLCTASTPLLCTEKDAVKLWPLHPDALAVPLQLRLPPAFWQLLDSKLQALAGPQERADSPKPPSAPEAAKSN